MELWNRHKYTLFVDVDSTFNMPWLRKKDDPNDLALNQGRGIFVEATKYKEYLKRHPRESNVGDNQVFFLLILTSNDSRVPVTILNCKT